jgi:hypothetical protein
MEAMMKKSLFAAAIAAAAALPLGGCASVAHLAGVNVKMAATCNNPDFVLEPKGCYYDYPRDCQRINVHHLAQCQKAGVWTDDHYWTAPDIRGLQLVGGRTVYAIPLQGYVAWLGQHLPDDERAAASRLFNTGINAGIRAAMGDYLNVAFPPMEVNKTDIQHYRESIRIGELPSGANRAGTHWESTFNGDLPLEINQQ